MAVIQKIRNRAGLLVAIIIGMALIAFILGDFLTSGGLYFSQRRAEVAEINGKGYSVEVYDRYLSEFVDLKQTEQGGSLDEFAMTQVRNQAWIEFIQDKVMGREYNRLGLSISSDEFNELITGENPHYIVRQFFGNQQTGQVDREAVLGFLSRLEQLNPDDPQKRIWLYYEDYIYNQRKLAKYQNLVTKGLYATSLETEKLISGYNKTVDFNYIVERFTSIPDSLISVSEEDLKSYYKENIENYKQDESRDLRYVVWEVKPSGEDFKAAEKWINDEYQLLVDEAPETSMQYVKSISDIAPENKNFAKGELSEKLDSFAFSSSPGAVYGPYFEDNAYKLAKHSEILHLPDSVSASHILFRIQTQQEYQQYKPLADSLLGLLKDGKANIAELAAKHSMDNSNSSKGGKLDWFKEGMMVQPFSDSCFYGKKGDIFQVGTQYGIHIVKIDDQSKPTKKVRLAVLTREVRASEKTDQMYYSEASAFGAHNNTIEKFNEGVKEIPSKLRYEYGLTPDKDKLANMKGSRELIRWAFIEAKPGQVTNKVWEFENKYVVAILDKVKEKGYIAFEDVKSQIEIEVKKQKKAEKLIAQLKEDGASDINTLASTTGIKVQEASNVNFNISSVPGLTNEEKVIGIASTLEEGAISEPIEGANGVYVLEVTNINVREDNSAMGSFQKSTIERKYVSRLTQRVGYEFQITATLNELAEVEDNRIRFY